MRKEGKCRAYAKSAPRQHDGFVHHIKRGDKDKYIATCRQKGMHLYTGATKQAHTVLFPHWERRQLHRSVKQSAICSQDVYKVFIAANQTSIPFFIPGSVFLLTMSLEITMLDVFQVPSFRHHVRIGWFIVSPMCRHPNPLPSCPATNVGEAARRALTDHLLCTHPPHIF